MDSTNYLNSSANVNQPFFLNDIVEGVLQAFNKVINWGIFCITIYLKNKKKKIL